MIGPCLKKKEKRKTKKKKERKKEKTIAKHSFPSMKLGNQNAIHLEQ